MADPPQQQSWVAYLLRSWQNVGHSYSRTKPGTETGTKTAPFKPANEFIASKESPLRSFRAQIVLDKYYYFVILELVVQ